MMHKSGLLLALLMGSAPLARAGSDSASPKLSGELDKHPSRTIEGPNKDQSITREALREEVYVPNLVGDNINRIGFGNALTRGFRTKIREDKDGTGLPKGQILSQSPKAGTQLRKPGEILLVIASGR